MKIEIGADIIDNNRFDGDILLNESFLKKYFSDEEIVYCFSQYDPKQHFAARFAGKEAVIKALSQFGIDIRISDIEISLKNNAPSIKILNEQANIKNLKIKISISHCEDKSIAFAIIYELG
ncbi:holo-ACP synthase [Methanospirillum stamsii]|uniref:ACP synthase n=1 Tax=Methanospirillum stamsii TaxID=1277351 RepID=A0A2V2MW50_9EURY|nr:4'-phosphopantetheinyl transferase superfamily protein [Methanospirillum stamsii]PWR69626.1 ACP synthase [Methanospirillum stamsii]